LTKSCYDETDWISLTMFLFVEAVTGFSEDEAIRLVHTTYQFGLFRRGINPG